MPSKRPLCVCGRSTDLPWCDGSHTEEDWNCSQAEDWEEFGFIASSRYRNLAAKLAAHFDGKLIHPDSPPVALGTSVTLVDGTELQLPVTAQSQVSAKRNIVVSFGECSDLLSTVFPQQDILDFSETEPLKAFHRIRRYLEGAQEETSTTKSLLGRGFLSHAVADEALLTAPTEYLRKFFQTDLFLCADSIAPGTDWQNEIFEALRQRDIFILLLSENTIKSTFCAFELGAAWALNKRIHIISLDGTPPPSFAQQLQMADLPRAKRQRPWLDLDDLLIEEILGALRIGKGQESPAPKEP